MAQIEFALKDFHRDAALRAAYSRDGMSGVNIEMIRRNERLAAELAQRAASRVADSIGTQSGPWSARRRAQSTGRLVRATGKVSAPGSPGSGNTVATPLLFGVGNTAFLDSSSSGALYWRQFEEGTTVHVGAPLRFVGPSRRLPNGPPFRDYTSLRPIRYNHGGKTIAITRNPIKAHHIYADLMSSGEANEMLLPLARMYYRQAIRLALGR